ncbi:MAG: prepilin-type N-terminal cleavage/methylation domain-containing protein [Byssovorax sp.]
MPLHRRPRLRARGFTLAELMIVVAIIGVMAAMAITGYRKHVNAAGMGEGKSMIQSIRAAEEAYKAEMLVYLGPSATLDDYYPQSDKLPNDKKWNWIQNGDARYTDPAIGWKLLNVQADAPVRYGYAVVAGFGPPMAAPIGFGVAPTLPTPTLGQPWFVVQAYNRRTLALPPVIMISSSMSSEIYVEGDGN